MDRPFSMLSVLVILGVVASIGVTLFGGSQAASRRLGATTSLAIPPGAQLVSMTWKEDSLWHLYYLPAENKCVFRESAPLGVLEGSVVVQNCNFTPAK